MKKFIAILLCAAMLFGLAACGGGSQNNNAANVDDDPYYVLKWAGQHGATHIYTTEFIYRFAEEIEKKSDGHIKIEAYPGEQMGKAADYLSMINTGLIDIANIDTGLNVAEFPLHGAWQLPGAFDTAWQGTPALNEMKENGILKAEMEKNGVVNLGCFTIPGYVLFYNSDKDIILPEDIKGMTIRATGKARCAAVEMLGATVVSMAASDISEALYKKSIDGCVSSANAGINYGYYEMASKCTAGMALGGLDGGYMMSKKVFDSMPEKYQKMMKETAFECSMHIAKILDEQLNDDLTVKIASKAKVIMLTEEQKAAWAEAVKDVASVWLDGIADKEAGKKVIEERNKTYADQEVAKKYQAYFTD